MEYSGVINNNGNSGFLGDPRMRESYQKFLSNQSKYRYNPPGIDNNRSLQYRSAQQGWLQGNRGGGPVKGQGQQLQNVLRDRQTEQAGSNRPTGITRENAKSFLRGGSKNRGTTPGAGVTAPAPDMGIDMYPQPHYQDPPPASDGGVTMPAPDMGIDMYPQPHYQEPSTGPAGTTTKPPTTWSY